MRAAVRRYNSEVPFDSMRITGDQIRASRRERVRRQRLFELGIPTPRRDLPLARDVQRLFPDAETEVEDVTRVR